MRGGGGSGGSGGGGGGGGGSRGGGGTGFFLLYLVAMIFIDWLSISVLFCNLLVLFQSFHHCCPPASPASQYLDQPKTNHASSLLSTLASLGLVAPLWTVRHLGAQPRMGAGAFVVRPAL